MKGDLLKRTISFMTGKGSLNHNSRKFHAKNTDPNRTHWNVEYCNEDIKDVYHELFDEALKRYNDKQTRKDRKIDDYYEKIRSGKQEKLFHEVIIQIGDKDNMGSETMEGQLAAKILDEYMKGFQERNPTLRIFAAHLHLDEATPHLHIDFMGLKSWKNAPDGKIVKTDVSIAKNYLGKEELAELNEIVTMYLDYATRQARRHIPMTMEDWKTKLDAFLRFNDAEVLQDKGKVTAAIAKEFAESEFEKYRVIQDSLYESDFDKLMNDMEKDDAIH